MISTVIASRRAMEEIFRNIREQHGPTASHIALVIPHPANLRINLGRA
jgi:3-oxoacyl-[acyl-carrier-protein] synthase III